MSERDIAKAMKERQHTRTFKPITVKDDLNWEEVNAVELNLPDLPGISIEIDQKRVYPFGGITSHILGYVAVPNENDVERDPDPLLKQPGFRIGKNGLERQYDSPLRGGAGESQLEVNSVGRVIRELARQEGQPGGDLVTTLDIGLQQFAQQRLSSEMAGAAVVMDVYTGDLLALASTPSFDPTAFYRGLTTDEWQELSNDIYGPLTNKAVAGQYAPGSTFKMITALAAPAGRRQPERPRLLHRRHRARLGAVPLLEARRPRLARHDRRAQAFLRLLLLRDRRAAPASTGSPRPRAVRPRQPRRPRPAGREAGPHPRTAWKRATFDEIWHPGETLVAGIGQGFITDDAAAAVRHDGAHRQRRLCGQAAAGAAHRR